MTAETALKHAIKDYLNATGVFWWYNLAGMGAQKGIPDIFALKDGVLYGIEAKAPKGVVSEYQTLFLAALKEAGGVPIIARDVEDVMEVL